MGYSFLAARLSFTFVYTCVFFSWQINSAAAAAAAAIFLFSCVQRFEILYTPTSELSCQCSSLVGPIITTAALP